MRTEKYINERYASCVEAINNSIKEFKQGRASGIANFVVGFALIDENIVSIPYLGTERVILESADEFPLIHKDLIDYHKDRTYELMRDGEPQPLYRALAFGTGQVEPCESDGPPSFSLSTTSGFGLAVTEVERKLALPGVAEILTSSIEDMARRIGPYCTAEVVR